MTLTEENCEPELKPWFRAKALIVEGKHDEAAQHIMDNVDVNANPPDCSLMGPEQYSVVFHVMLALAGRLTPWLKGYKGPRRSTTT